MANDLFSGLLNLIYPPYCIGCNESLSNNKNVLCLECLNNLPYTEFQHSTTNPTAEKFYGRINIENAYSLLFFAKDSIVQNLMHALKYQNNKNVGIFLGKLLANKLNQSSWIKNIDTIVPLPLHKNRLKNRGYNQSEIISKALSQEVDIKVDNESIRRTIHTETQTGKSREERWLTMQNVFSICNTNSLANKHILLIDDTITTGATLEACGEQILKIKNTKLSIATIAFVL